MKGDDSTWFVPLLLPVQMDIIAGSFYDGFMLYAKALDETLAAGGAQNDGINITMRTQNQRFWGEQMFGNLAGLTLA